MHEAGQARVNMKGRSFMYEEKGERGERASVLNSVGCRTLVRRGASRAEIQT